MRRLVVIVALLAFVFAISSSVFAQPNPGEATHVVQRGENLYRISLKYGVTMAAIATRNNITNYNLIFTGQWVSPCLLTDIPIIIASVSLKIKFHRKQIILFVADTHLFAVAIDAV